MNICFVMYPWENVEPEFDSTLRIVHEAKKRGHLVAITYPNNLTVRASESHAFCKVIRPMDKFPNSVKAFYQKVKFKERMLPLSGFDAIVMRSNPPLDNLALNFLDAVSENTLIVNSIHGLRTANNKLYAATYHDVVKDLIPETHVSKNKDYLKRVIEDSKKDKMILKPLNGYGGKGVIILEKSASKNINSLLDFYINTSRTESNYVILQEYIDGADLGDVRVIMLNGEPIGAMKRVPAKDDNRSNIHSGGMEVRYTLSKTEVATCRKIGKRLVADGLNLVGLDFIGSKLIEINVLSPGGITRINKLNRTNLQAMILDWLEDEVFHHQKSMSKKSALRQEIEDNASA